MSFSAEYDTKAYLLLIKNIAMNSTTLSKDYMSFLNNIKSAIQNAHIRAHLAVNKELIILYWHIGNEILNRKKN